MASSKKWLEHYPESVPKDIELDDLSLHHYLKKAANEFPTKSAIHFLGKEMTYQELYNDVLKLASQLQALGLKKGERISVMLPNSPQAVIAYYAVLVAGGVVVQTNPLYMERELEHQLSDSGSKMMICIDMAYPKVKNVLPKTQLQEIIVTGVQDYLPFPKNVLYPWLNKKKLQSAKEQIAKDRVHAFKTLVEKGTPSVTEVTTNPRQDLALLQYTGGTTGLAKGVMLTHHNLIANTVQSQHWMYKTTYSEESILGILPFFHVYGMTIVMNLSIMHVSRMIILPNFDAKEVLKTIQKQKPTLFPGAPTMYVGLIHHPDIQQYDLSSIETCISGSAPLPREVQQKFEDLTGGRLVEGYGLTEAAPVTHCNLIWEENRKGSIGLPWPGTDAMVYDDETGLECDLNTVGELAVKGPQVMKGYWNRPEDTKGTFHEDWLLTGDMAYMDEAGYFYIVDRKKDTILAGGFNIYPREVEEVLYEHSAVKEAAVIGVPDAYRGETVKAFVVSDDGYPVSEADLEQHCRKHLAAYKIPRIYEFRESLPKTTVGKVLKRSLNDDQKGKMGS
ncbi:AMP-binding protein [Tuberibacillus sp. Marseille-P3662]|uniref:AMP-binding protein n=1 Tax=Tuberibacillus sp. Marseille-P3662 TaxID=1965358 RepID=UPI000A1CD896|nr:AMP-binding protein [Tuberibacillus sp. Marseille-P3662]